MSGRLSLTAGAVLLGATTGSVRADPEFIGGIEYAVVEGRSLKLDLYLPDDDTFPGPHPVIVFIHAGAWQFGERGYAYADAPLMNIRGYAVAAIDYRFSWEALWPAQMHDCKGAVRWLRAHAAQYNFDVNRFVSFGDSAGGHLSSVLAMSAGVPGLEGTVGGNLEQPSHVQACIDFMGPTRFLEMTGFRIWPGSSASLLIGQTLSLIIANRDNPDWRPWVDLCHSADPSFHVDQADPPVFIGHGPADTVVEFNQSVIFANELAVDGVAHEFRVIPELNHERTAVDLAASLAFLDPIIDPPGRPQPPPCADVTGDGVVSIADLSLVVTSWGETEIPGQGGDVSGDGVIDLEDLAFLLEQWDNACVRPSN